MFRSGEPGDPMPFGTAAGLALLLAAGGIVLMLVGRRASDGRLRMNPLVGIRTTLTLNSEIAWDAAHRAGGRFLSIAGLGPLLTGPVLLTRPTNAAGVVIVLSGLTWMVGWILRAGVVGTRAAEKALEAEGD